MEEKKEIFMMDSSSFITTFESYYHFDLIPTFWEKISLHISSGRIVVLDKVRDEIKKQDDELNKWIRKREKLQIIHIDTDTTEKYSEVIKYIYGCGLYKNSALNEWSKNDVADPWLIASCLVHGYTLVTQEIPSGGLSEKTKNKKAKIPDVADHFRVKNIKVFDMMRKLNIKI